MVLVDTSVWIDYFRGVKTWQAERLEQLLDGELVCTGDLILAELLQGFRVEKELAAARKLMDALEYRDLGGKDVALKAAGNYRKLRAKGSTIRKTIDVIIGTFCIENNVSILHNDRDFDLMEKHLGLSVVK